MPDRYIPRAKRGGGIDILAAVEAVCVKVLIKKKMIIDHICYCCRVCVRVTERCDLGAQRRSAAAQR
jgi:hypothetical protein